MSRFLQKALPWLGCVLAGGLLSLPYFFEGAFLVAFPALGLLFALLQRSLRGKEFRAFFLFFAGFYGPLYSFLSALHPLNAAGFTDTESVWTVIGACTLIPLIHALLSAAVLQFGRFLPRGPIFRSLGYATLWVVHEWLCTLGDFAFPWGTLALSQTGFAPLLQTASFFGSSGISLFVVAVSCLLGCVFARYRIIRSLSAAGTLIAAFLIAGTVLWVRTIPQDTNPDAAVSVAVLQGNASTEEKWTTEEKTETARTYLELAHRAGQNGAEWIVFPESAIPANFAENGPLHDLFKEIASSYDATVIAGVLMTDDSGVHNRMTAVLPDGSVAGYYEKQHLVPFGETIPLRGFLDSIFPFLKGFSLGGITYEKQTTEPLLDLDSVLVSCYICYDADFPAATDGTENAGVIVTNDSWFNKSDAMLSQHVRFAKLRAVETGKDIVRAANTGISAFIDRKGVVTAQSEKKTETILYGTLHKNGERTLYSRAGAAFVPVCGGIFAVLLLGNLPFLLRSRKQ